MVDARDSKSRAARRAGSIPALGTSKSFDLYSLAVIVITVLSLHKNRYGHTLFGVVDHSVFFRLYITKKPAQFLFKIKLILNLTRRIKNE